MPVRDGEAAARAARGSTVAARHVGGRGGLVEEDQPVGIEGVLVLEPRLASGPYVFARLLGGVDRPFMDGPPLTRAALLGLQGSRDEEGSGTMTIAVLGIDLTGWLWTGLIERISQDRRSRTCGEVRRRARSRLC